MKVAVVGCGHVSEKHIHSLRRLSGVEIVGVCDRDKATADSCARRHGIKGVYEQLSTLLAHRHPDVVHVLTPPQMHSELAIQAMDAGCHVLVEKPMASTLQEADEMVRVSRDSGVWLCVCHNFLFEPCVLRVRKLVSEGALGRVLSVEIFWRTLHESVSGRHGSTPWIADLPGGIFHEVAPHPVYLQLEFLRNPRVFSAMSKRTQSGETADDELRIQFDAESAVGCVSISIHTHPHQAFMRIYGTRMTLHVDFTTNTLVRLRKQGVGRMAKLVGNLDQSLQLSAGTIANSARVFAGRMSYGHETLIRRFYDGLNASGVPPVTAEAGRAAVATLEAIWAALADRGRA